MCCGPQGPTPARVLFSADESDEPTSHSHKSSPTTVPRKSIPSSIPPKNPNWLAEARGATFRPGRRSLSSRSSKVPPLSLSRLARTVSGEGLHSANNDAEEPIPSPALTATTNTTDAFPSRTTTARTTARSSAPALSRRSTAAAAAAGAAAPATPHTPHTPASSNVNPYEATPPSPNAPNASLLAALPDERPTAHSTTARSMARSTARSATTNRSNWSTQVRPSPLRLSRV